MDATELLTFLSGHRYGVISSVADDGTPQSALIGLAVTDSFEVVFDTLRSSRKYVNLLERPRCSLVIGWTGERTAQLEGVARLPVGSELEPYLRTYLAAWPDGEERLRWPGIAHLVVRCTWARYSDYGQAPVQVREFNLGE